MTDSKPTGCGPWDRNLRKRGTTKDTRGEHQLAGHCSTGRRFPGGDLSDPATEEMLNVINNTELLDMNVIVRPTVDSSTITKLAPFTENLLPVNNKTTIYFCKGHECEMPITNSEILAQHLAEFSTKNTED